jgi:3-phytase
VKRAAIAVVLLAGTVSAQSDQPTVFPIVRTAPLVSYEDAPATSDADDPAIWVNRHDYRRSLVIGTAKDAGLLAYDLSGRLVQAIFPPNAPQVLEIDPPTPAGTNTAADTPCAESESGETFGRYNNVDIAYDVQLGNFSSARRVDVAVVSDRGCDRVRFFAIDPSNPNGPLVDITSPDVPRVFPRRYDQPSAVQPSGDGEGWADNPLDDQNTVYGLTVAQGHTNDVFVTERERGLVRQLTIEPTSAGTLTYRTMRTFLFDTSFDLDDESGEAYAWTPCREAVEEEPQSEGLVFDLKNETLFVAFETIGLYRLQVTKSTPDVVRVGRNRLIEPVRSFGQAYHAIPDDDEFDCEYDPEGTAEPETIEAPGSNANVGAFIQADLEGLSIVTSSHGEVVLLASSQGDSSFHFYWVRNNRPRPRHLGSFLIDGVGDTDGVHYVPVAVTPKYPLGLLVVQNGEAPVADGTPAEINGFELDGATQFLFVNFADTLRALRE